MPSWSRTAWISSRSPRPSGGLSSLPNDQPTAIVYRTRKGWQYGVEGKASHGAGHGLCADGFFQALTPFVEQTAAVLPRCASANQRCQAGKTPEVLEECFWEALTVIRSVLGKQPPDGGGAGAETAPGATAPGQPDPQTAAARPCGSGRLRSGGATAGRIPAELTLTPGQAATLRGELGRVLQYYNHASKGAVLTASADLYASTSVNTIAQGFPEGWYNAATNPGSRMLAAGGICEDAMCGILAGLSTYGHHLGVGSSYGAFIAALGHVAARLHAIGNQARQAIAPGPYAPFILICAHAGVKTGEDGPTHADPQALQLLQGNFPLGTMITLTPWDPQEIWPLMSAALARRPAVIAPFVTRPSERVIDRQALGLPPATAAVTGVYRLCRAEGKEGRHVGAPGQRRRLCVCRADPAAPAKKGDRSGCLLCERAELFDLLPAAAKDAIYPETAAREAMGITGFTLPTMERWVCSAPRPDADAASFPERALPGQRFSREGAGRGRPRRRKPVQGHSPVRGENAQQGVERMKK